MDALFTLSPGHFSQVTSHISIYREPMSESWENFTKECLTAAGLKSEQFSLWNVPKVKDLLSKSTPVEVHGRVVIVDEEEMEKMQDSTYGVTRYMLRSSAARCKEGGRYFYDYAVLNFTFLVSTIMGGGLLYKGRRDWNSFTRRPGLAIFGCFCFTALACPAIKMLFKLFSVGMIFAERSHRRTLGKLNCRDCLTDVNEHSIQQIDELRKKQIEPPKKLPGVPEPPPEYIEQMRKQANLQADLLEREVELMKTMIRKQKDSFCDVHAGLRADPKGYNHPLHFPITPKDRVVAEKRVNDPDTILSEEENKKPKKMKIL